VKDVVLEVAEDYAKLTGRKYGILEEYKLDDAEVVLIAMNSAAVLPKRRWICYAVKERKWSVKDKVIQTIPCGGNSFSS